MSIQAMAAPPADLSELGRARAALAAAYDVAASQGEQAGPEEHLLVALATASVAAVERLDRIASALEKIADGAR